MNREPTWTVTPDGWRYRQILSVEFIHGPHLPQPGEVHPSWQHAGNKLVGGTLYPVGSWLVIGPHEAYAQALFDAEFAAWRARHQDCEQAE